MFDVEFDAGAKLLTLRLSGFWSEGTMTAFEDAFRRKVAEAGRAGAVFDTLSDASDFPVQSASVAARFGALTRTISANRRGRMAIVVASTLNKMQAERSIGGKYVQAFLDRDAAVEWLAEGR